MSDFSEVRVDHIESYAASMTRTMEDKLFFLDKTPTKLFVDYGCADGSMGTVIRSRVPDARYVGFDISSSMIARGKRLDRKNELYDRWEDTLSCVGSEPAVLILSSIIHEAYAYGRPMLIETFFDRTLRDKRWRYIAIRDMIPRSNIDRKSNLWDVINVRRRADPKQIAEYEKRWGPITNQRSLIGYVLRYRYIDNWARELDEDYMPINEDTLLSMITGDLEVIYARRETPSFIKRRALIDLDVESVDDVHLSLILKRKDS